jgi:hypothetical protein
VRSGSSGALLGSAFPGALADHFVADSLSTAKVTVGLVLARCGVGPPDHFPLAGCFGQAVAGWNCIGKTVSNLEQTSGSDWTILQHMAPRKPWKWCTGRGRFARETRALRDPGECLPAADTWEATNGSRSSSSLHPKQAQ